MANKILCSKHKNLSVFFRYDFLWTQKTYLYFSDLVFSKHKNWYLFLDLIFSKLKNWSVFSNLIFSKHKNWSVFFRSDFLEKDFFVSKWQILKFIKEKRLKVRLKFFLCDACIINLSHECGSSFKKSFLIFCF